MQPQKSACWVKILLYQPRGVDVYFCLYFHVVNLSTAYEMRMGSDEIVTPHAS